MHKLIIFKLLVIFPLTLIAASDEDMRDALIAEDIFSETRNAINEFWPDGMNLFCSVAKGRKPNIDLTAVTETFESKEMKKKWEKKMTQHYVNQVKEFISRFKDTLSQVYGSSSKGAKMYKIFINIEC